MIIDNRVTASVLDDAARCAADGKKVVVLTQRFSQTFWILAELQSRMHYLASTDITIIGFYNIAKRRIMVSTGGSIMVRAMDQSPDQLRGHTIDKLFINASSDFKLPPEVLELQHRIMSTASVTAEAEALAVSVDAVKPRRKFSSR